MTTQAPDLSAMVQQIGAMFERAYALEATRPSREEIETVLMDGYACALELERERSEIERQTSLLIAEVANGGHAGELRLLSARHIEVDRNVRWLRSLLVELRDYRASLPSSE
jgi:hypothetical protein